MNDFCHCELHHAFHTVRNLTFWSCVPRWVPPPFSCFCKRSWAWLHEGNGGPVSGDLIKEPGKEEPEKQLPVEQTLYLFYWGQFCGVTWETCFDSKAQFWMTVKPPPDHLVWHFAIHYRTWRSLVSGFCLLWAQSPPLKAHHNPLEITCQPLPLPSLFWGGYFTFNQLNILWVFILYM